MTFPWQPLAIGFTMGAVLCRALPIRIAPEEGPPRRSLGMAAALVGGTLAISLLPAIPDLPPGPKLSGLPLAALPLLFATSLSDATKPKSERHVAGLLASGALLALFGLGIPILSSPTLGTISLAAAWQYLLTMLWLLLLASLVEMASFLPAGLLLFGLGLPAWVLASSGAHQTGASVMISFMTAGAVLGCTLGRALAGRHLRGPSKTDVFALGLWLTTLTNISFMKSATFGTLVLPSGILLAAAVLLALRAFERSLILRDRPR